MIVVASGTGDDGNSSVLVADNVILRTLTTWEIVAAILFAHTAGVVLLARLAGRVETLILDVLA